MAYTSKNLELNSKKTIDNKISYEEKINILIENKIKLWKRKLLDLSKRNNLINYRFTKSKSIKIIEPQFDEVLNLLIKNKNIYFKKKMSKNSAKVGDCLSSEDDKVVEKKLYRLYLQFQENKKELGIQTCFIALGMLKYKDAEISDKFFKSPIFLFPVIIDRLPRTYMEKHRFVIFSEDDPKLNPILKEKLKHEYQINLKDFREDKDEIPNYMQYLRKMLSGMKDWEINQEVYLDIFSYQKQIMQDDLVKYESIIKNSPLVREFVAGPEALEERELAVNMEDFGPNFDDSTSIDVLPADSSQKKAIELARRGVSFVLQGPPGTGKSQTIANLIIDFIYEGKKILFVSQKMAALDVVQKRLDQVGFGNYCLNLHKYRGTKKEILKQFSESINYFSKLPDCKAWLDPELYLNTQREVNEFYSFLCEKHKTIETSVYETRGEIAKLSNVEIIDFPFEEKVILLNKNKFSELHNNLSQIENLLSKIKNPLSPIILSFKDGVDTPLSKIKLKKTLESIKAVLSQIDAFIDNTKEQTKFDIKTFEDLNLFANLEKEFKNRKLNKAPNYLINTEYIELYKKTSHVYNILVSIANIKSYITKKVNASFIDMDSEDIEKILKNTSFLGRIFSSKYRKYIKELRKYTKNEVNHKEWLDLFVQKNKINNLKHDLSLAGNQISDVIGNYNDLDYVKKIYDFLSKIIKFHNDVKEKGFSDAHKIIEYLYSNQININDLVEKLLKNTDRLNQFFEINVFQSKGKINTLEMDINLIESNFENLRDIVVFKGIYKKLPKSICKFIDIYYSKRNSYKHKFIDIFLKSYYLQLLDKLLEEKNIPSPKESVRILREEDEDIRNLVRNKYIKTIENRKPKNDFGISNGETSFLKHEIMKKRRIKPIREILKRTKNLAFILRPCFMMSPLTVSKYIDPESIHFDVVIFDEASQIMPEDAVACLARADQAIIMGDTEQLPPTTFFMKDNEGDEEDEDIEDLDSFLKESVSKFTTKSLNWHYRSKDESLIAFSNRKFYNNRLITFPNPDSKEQGVEFIYVEDGIYDRGHSRKNRKEAEKLVEIYKKQKQIDPEKSIGIVAFSRAQEDAIRDALVMAKIDPYDSKDPNEEGLFVKNLETVQGDERDIIILSIGYGRDTAGKLSYNFGPINKNEGYKRLNVAITRSRYKTIVVSSILPEDLDEDKISDNVKILKDYLDYAKNKRIVKKVEGTKNFGFDSPFEEAVYDALVEEGFDVSTQVGCSGYRIDLAIKDPSAPGRYILGIECDGAQYHSSRYARDRDKIRQSILEGLGWKIHRIWSEDWLDNKEQEMNKIKKKVYKLLDEKKRTPRDYRRVPHSSETEIKQVKRIPHIQDYPKYSKYRVVDLSGYYEIELDFDSYGLVTGEDFIIKEIKNRIRAALRVESPIEKELLYKRIINSLGLRRKGKHSKTLFLKALNEMKEDTPYRIYINQNTVSDKPVNRYYPFRMSSKKDRPFKLIPKEELAQLVIDILKNEFSLSFKDLMVAVARTTYGNGRVGEKMKEKMEEVLEYLAKNKTIKKEGDKIELTA